jgi:DNA-binding PadR family transcriptional regulator
MTPPVFGHGSLRLYLLSLLEEAPKHGYELIQALEQRFGGTYSPSAGTIYPRLAKLEEDGLVTKTTQGRKTVYEITEQGRRELERREGELRDIEAEVTDSVRRLADEVRHSVNQALKSLRADLASAAGGEPGERAGASDPSAADAAAAHDAPGAGHAPEPPGIPHHDPRVESRFALREAEMALNDFRQHVRSDLRTAAARGELTDAALERLRSELVRVRTEILEMLQR